MEVKQVNERWLARKNKKAKRWEDITDLMVEVIPDDFLSVMGKAGRTSFHSYLGKSGSRWLEMYGVTSLLNYWGEKEKLLQWAVDKAVDHIELWAAPMLLDDEDGAGYLKDGLYAQLDIARKAHLRSLEDAGAHGTDVHALVEAWINQRMAGEAPALVENPQLQAFIDWSDRARFLASEKPLRSRRLWCAGTTDFICEIDGKTFIGDVKTSRFVSFKHFLQCGAYALFYEEMGLGKIDGIVITHMRREGGFGTYMDMDVEKYKKLFEALVMLAKADKDKSYQLYS